MKNVLIKAAVLSIAMVSGTAFAEKVVISGEPVVLEKQGDMYMVPGTYKARQDYQYVVIDGTKRACFLDKRPDFANLDVVSINVKVTGETATWNCYSIDPTYFVVQ